jgi:hypothetical protein
LFAAAIAIAFGTLAIPGRAQSLEARGYAEATTVGNFVDSTLMPATGADSVTRSATIADSHIPGLSGMAQVGGTARFGALSGSSSATASGDTANSLFQAQPVAIAQDYVTIHGVSPANLTLHYAFEASMTVPNNQRGTVYGFDRSQVFFYPSGFVDNSQVISDDAIFAAGNTTTAPGAIVFGDASRGASGSISGSMTVQVNPGATYGLYGALQLAGEDQNLNSDGHQIDIAVAGSMRYWITFDSSADSLTSQSGATYNVPRNQGSVPDSANSAALFGLALAGVGCFARLRGRQMI